MSPWVVPKARLKANPERAFYHQLALELGCTVEELLTRMSSQELTDWFAFYEWREDRQRLAEAAAEAKQKARRLAGGR